MATVNNSVTGWTGWIYFAGILMILRGISEAFLGITALINHQYLFITGNNQLVLATTHTDAWGWVQLVVGLLVLAAGFSLLHGSNWARIFAIIFASFAFLVNMAFLSVFPVWSIVAMLVDVFIIYALVVHGREVAL
jgi:hypothetical protein